MKPLRFRFLIATLTVGVALLAVDLAWLRTIFGQHRAVFEVTAEGYDTG